MQGKYCLIYNFPQHYRETIFKKMDDEIDCDFYFGDKLDWAPDIKPMNVEGLKGFKGILKNKKIFKLFIWQKGAFMLVFKNYQHYILYGDSFYISNYFLVLFAKLLGKKTYLWTHGINQDLSWRSKIFNYPFYYFATKVLLYGNFSRNYMIKLGFNEKKLLCIYNSLNYYEQIKIRRKLSSSEIYKNYFKNNHPVIIYIGRIQKVKKINLLIESIGILKNEGININLIIVGEDQEQVNVLSIANNFNLLKNVWMYGDCYDEVKIGELIYNADVCVSPGNIGLTAIHSLVYGTPAITHSNYINQMPEFESIVDGVTGGFFTENNVSHLAIKIKEWIDLDISKRAVIRENCFNIIDNIYNPNNQINLIKSLDND
jgi:glycosyltransferase involved in cell wall biosynthesis